MPWQFSPNVLLTPIDSEAVLLNTVTSENYALNPLALNICALIESGLEIPDIVKQLQEQFPEVQTQIPRDVQEFVSTLQTEGLLFEADLEDPKD